MYSYFASSDAHRGIQNIYLDIYSNILPTILSPFILAYSGNLFDILSGMFVSGVSSDFFLAFYLIYLQIFFVVNMPCLMIVTFFLAFYLQSFSVVEVRLRSLSSSGCCSGPAGNTAI